MKKQFLTLSAAAALALTACNNPNAAPGGAPNNAPPPPKAAAPGNPPPRPAVSDLGIVPLPPGLPTFMSLDDSNKMISEAEALMTRHKELSKMKVVEIESLVRDLEAALATWSKYLVAVSPARTINIQSEMRFLKDKGFNKKYEKELQDWNTNLINKTLFTEYTLAQRNFAGSNLKSILVELEMALAESRDALPQVRKGL